MRRFGRPKQQSEPRARCGSDREPAQIDIAGARQPREQRMAGTRTQHLLGRPQRIAPARRPYHGEAFEPHASHGQRRGIGQVRRRKPGDVLAIRGQRRERGKHELQLAHAFAHRKNLGQRSCRPAAAGQLAVERRETARHRGRRHWSECAAAPDGGPAKDVLQGGHGYCDFIQYPRERKRATRRPGASRTSGSARRQNRAAQVPVRDRKSRYSGGSGHR